MAAVTHLESLQAKSNGQNLEAAKGDGGGVAWLSYVITAKAYRRQGLARSVCFYQSPTLRAVLRQRMPLDLTSLCAVLREDSV
eukprot:3941122-Rhodomonas_salina.1